MYVCVCAVSVHVHDVNWCDYWGNELGATQALEELSEEVVVLRSYLRPQKKKEDTRCGHLLLLLSISLSYYLISLYGTVCLLLVVLPMIICASGCPCNVSM